MIPAEPASSTESLAERRLFERLQDDTADDLVAFHSVAWLTPGDRGRPRQGEADFVLAHPKHGVIALEVKGGSIRFDAANGKWYSGGRSGETEIKDPVRQAARGRYSLRDLLARSARDGASGISLGHAVAFPDTRAGSRRLKTDVPREIVIDHGDLSRLDERVLSLFRYWQGDEPPLGTDGVKRLESLLANSFVLPSPLAFELEAEERTLLQLTEQQYTILDTLSRHTRVAIGGCAGSGKTFLAAEKARRLARQGFKVLVLCFNVLLARHLRRGLRDVEEIDVCSFDDLCYRIGREAGYDFPENPEPGEEHKHYKRLRELFAESAEIAAGRYGALIVDEAQDFDPEWWLPLQLLLEDPDRSPLYLFYDDNQRIFPVTTGFPISEEPFQLTVNCRNTQRINEVVRAYYKGETVEARGPEGLPVEAHFYDTETELLEQLETAVRSWINEAEVPPEQIALLSAHGPQRSALWQVDELGGIPLTDDPWEKGKILRSTVHRFKGLERMVVGIVELDGASDKVLYIGFSRPSVFLSIFCPNGARRRLPPEVVRAAA
jgi:hypothetical protein